MSEDLDKVAGKIRPAPTSQEIEDALKLQTEKRHKDEERLKHAAQSLKELLKTKEMQRIGWAMQFGFRLTQWAQMEASGIKGMNEIMLVMFAEAQKSKVQESGFDFPKIVADFKEKQLRWIEERLRESQARQRSRERRVKQLSQKLRRTDVPLPFHSCRALFGPDGFTHNDSLSLIGHAEGVRLALRFIASEYRRAGGTVLFLTEGKEPEPARTAALSMTGVQWINCCQILARLAETLDPLIKAGKQAPGLVVVESLDHALVKSDLGMDRQARLQLAFGMLKQYQLERGFALVAGVHTDADPEGVDPMQIYPPLLLGCPFVQVKVEDSKLVEWSKNVCVGNDVLTLDELKKKVEEQAR